jgi:hypothetical protein
VGRCGYHGPCETCGGHGEQGVEDCGAVRSEEMDGYWDGGVATRETESAVGVLNVVLVERGRGRGREWKW